MKYIWIGIVVLVFIGGILFGMNVQKSPKQADTPSVSSQQNVLDLRGKQLTKVGADIYNQTGTTQLLLSNNEIRTLPSEMGRMTNLTTFKIDHNRLDGSLIGEIRKMSRLQVLDASYNNMTGVPAEIGQLHELSTLNLSHNKLDTMPNEIANLKDTLKVLDLSGNPYSQDTIDKIKAKLPSTDIIF